VETTRPQEQDQEHSAKAYSHSEAGNIEASMATLKPAFERLVVFGRQAHVEIV
jgi:hypothetical protein